MATAAAPAPPDADPRVTPAHALAPRAAGSPPRAPRLRLLRHEPDADETDDSHAPAPHPAMGAPGLPPPVADLRPTAELRRRAHQVVWLVLEVLGGRRPLGHLAPHLEPPALRYMRAALGQTPAARRTWRMTSLHVHRPCGGALEVAAVHRAGDRARVLTARFEGPPDEPDRWRCVTLRLL